MRRLRGVLLIAGLFCSLAHGQNRRATIRGHLHPALRSATDIGRVPGDLQLQPLTITFQLPAEKRTQLDALLVRQQDPASPDFHKWLTPEDYAARFGASDSDIAATRTWLQSQGLQVKSVARGRDAIYFSGQARQVESAFGTELHRYSVNGETHFANVSEPTVAAVLEGKIAAIHGLHDFRMRPPGPRYTSATTGNHYLSPDDFATIYNVKPLYDRGITGTGQKVAVVGQTQVTLPDLQLFRSSFNLPASDPQMLLVPNGGDPGVSNSDLGEALLDIDWVGALARNASILYVYSSDVTDAAFYVIDQNLAPVISMSYGLCEPQISGSDLSLLQSYARRAAGQCITWVAASGDAGAADCYSNTSRIAAALAVDAPASVPEVTGIGGTTFTEGSGNYWNASNDANRSSALSYIPETSWNDVSSGNLSASGGGASTVFPKPSWQTGAGVPNDNARDVPDIALSASAGHVAYLVYQNGNLQAFGGTSAPTPAFAGIVALLNQYQVANGLQSAAGMGNLNPRLYAMAALVPNAFHDVTSGTNMVNPCSPRVVTCTSGNIGFSAGPGYDQVTGLGSVDAFNLVTGWGVQAQTKSPVTISLTSSVASVPLNGSILLTASVASANGSTPTGSVSFFAGTAPLGTVLIAGSGGNATATLTVPVCPFTVGSVSFTAIYNADAAFSSATSSATTVTLTAATSIMICGAVNAGSYKANAAPGMILAVFGSLLAGSAESAAVLPLPTTLSGVSATVNGTPAPLYYVSPGQINLQVPYSIVTGPAILQVTYNGQTTTASFNVSTAAPGIFAANGSPVPDQTAKRGQTVSLYITGEGAATPALVSGSLPPAGITARPVQAVSVSVGGIPASLAYVGVPAWAIGATQINYTVPANAPLGAMPVIVTVGSIASASVILTVTP